MKLYKAEKAFTLIELLIVIVIIGILAGVLIVVIDPNTKQNQAGDATIKSGINKVVLVVEGFLSSYGGPPTDSQFLASIQAGSTEFGASCSGNDFECLFRIQAATMSAGCDAGQWKGSATDTNECYMRYYAGSSLPGNSPGVRNHFRIYAKSSGKADSVFVYDSESGGKIYDCPYTITDSDPTSVVCEAL